MASSSSSPIFNIRDWNKQNLNRQVPYSQDERFPTCEVRPRINQYTKSDIGTEFNSTYKWLISNTEIKKNETEHFQCWKPKHGISGIDNTVVGYKRMSFNGKKVLCHVLVWLFHHPGISMENDDVSHRCHNNWCCRPSHLVKEDRMTNKSRDHCLGYLVDRDDTKIVIKVCDHEPPCRTSSYFSRMKDYVTLEFEQ